MALIYGFPVWYIVVFSSLAVVNVISNILVMCIWLKPKVRSHVTIRLAARSLSDSIRVIFPGICLPIASYSNIQDNQTVYLICNMISAHIPIIFHLFFFFFFNSFCHFQFYRQYWTTTQQDKIYWQIIR